MPNPMLVPETVKVILLAVVQGIAEFLPISSSGHLVVMNELLGTGQGSVELNIILHLGTLLAILVFYWRRVWALLSTDRRVIPRLIVGTIPAAVIGVLVKTNFEQILSNPLLTGFMFIGTGMMLLVLPRLKTGQQEYQNLAYWQVFLIGCAQAVALLPGISRSGATIVAGAALGLQRQSAATFSFLLAIPAIAGASMLEIKDMIEAGETTTSPSLLVLGALIAFVVGLISLQWLVKWIETGKLHYFAYWVIPLGLGLIVWYLLS